MSANMLLQVQQRDQYGQKVYHPVNSVAQAFAEIAGTRTLTPRVLQLAEGLGFVIEPQATDLDAWRNRGGL